MYFILALRFLLEVTAVLGFLLALIIKQSWLEKGLFLLLGVVIVFFWSYYMTPKASHSLLGWQRLVTELLIFILVSLGFWRIYGWKVAMIYFILAMGNLFFLYLFHLN